MTKFIFRTTTTVKPRDNKKWWVSSDMVTEKRIQAENINKAIKIWAEMVREEHYIDISANAIKDKNQMYIDGPNGEPVQIGYVITGKTDFQCDGGKWSTRYIDLWVEILTVVDTKF